MKTDTKKYSQEIADVLLEHYDYNKCYMIGFNKGLDDFAGKYGSLDGALIVHIKKLLPEWHKRATTIPDLTELRVVDQPPPKDPEIKQIFLNRDVFFTWDKGFEKAGYWAGMLTAAFDNDILPDDKKGGGNTKEEYHSLYVLVKVRSDAAELEKVVHDPRKFAYLLTKFRHENKFTDKHKLIKFKGLWRFIKTEYEVRHGYGTYSEEIRKRKDEGYPLNKKKQN